MATKSGPKKQPSAIMCIELIAQTHGYTVQTREKDPKVSGDEKKFLPDVVAQPFKGKGKRVFEVEATSLPTIQFTSPSLAHSRR